MAEMTKAAMYREALEKLGLDVAFADFVDYLKRNHKLQEKEIAQSAFYTERNKMKAKANGEEPVPKTRKKKAASAESGPTTFSVADLPAIMGTAKELVEKFGGDKESLVKFVQAM